MNLFKPNNNFIVVNSHIPKNAGTTMVDILRRTYGVAHFDVLPRMNSGILQYTGRELQLDMKRFPWMQSISGHFLRPWEDYGKISEKLLWFVFLRDPIQRFLSQYEYQVMRYNLSPDFFAWKRKYTLNNQQVIHLAGALDLDAAKQILETRISVLGLVERFDESLLIIKKRLNLNSLNIKYRKARNTSNGTLKKEILDDYDKYKDIICESNLLDIELYDYAINVLWRRQTLEYGEDQLQLDRNFVFDHSGVFLKDIITGRINQVFRNAVYKPLTWILS